MSTTLLTAVAIAAALAALGATVLPRPADGAAAPITPTTVLRALVVAGSLTVVAMLGAAALLHDLFVIVHVAYLGVVVTLPIVAVGLLARTVRRPAARWVRPALAVALLPVPIGIYATHVEPYWLRVDHLAVPLPAARAGSAPVTVGVLSDLQTTGVGPYERRVVDRLMATRPDVILLPGDLFQGPADDHDVAALRALLGDLRAPGGVYFVQGDCEGPDYRDLLAGLDITVLDDQVVTTRVRDRTLHIGGTRLDFRGTGAEEVRTELQRAPDEDVTILLSHRPDTVLRLPASSRIDLTVAGHTHGGQVVVPGIGPLMTLSEVPRHIARGGLGTVDGNRIYVSPGIGLERGHAPQVRLGNRPALGILTLDGPADSAT